MQVKGTSKDNGFTLIELMLISAIIGILAVIAVPKFSNMLDRAREGAFKGNLGALRSALSVYYVDNEGQYPKYFSVNPVTYPGLMCLHNKYCDLSAIQFTLPRYAGGLSVRAIDLYKFPGAFGAMQTMAMAPDPIFPIVYSFLPWPQYYNWYPATVSPPPPVSYACIGMNPFSIISGDALLDTAGKGWSLW